MGLISRVSSRTYRLCKKMNNNHFNEFFNTEQKAITTNNEFDQQLSKKFGSLMSPFDHMDTFFKNPENSLMNFSKELENTDSKSYCYSHSSVTKFDEKGQKYQKTHSITTGPDGVKQEKKTLEDRDEKLKQMSLGQHIKNRGIEVEKTRRGGVTAPIETKRNLYG